MMTIIFHMILFILWCFDFISIPVCKQYMDNLCVIFILEKSELLTSFSLTLNTAKLLAPDHSKDSLPCLNGFRVVAMAWVLLGHRLFHMLILPSLRLKDFSEVKIVCATGTSIYIRNVRYYVFLTWYPHTIYNSSWIDNSLICIFWDNALCMTI